VTTPRVVSLVPSVTETLLAWGVRPAAVTRFCEQPRLPAVGGTKDPDIAGIVAMRPDLVVVDREENRAEDAAALEAAGLEVHVLHVISVEDVAPALDGLAGRLGLGSPVGTNALPVPNPGPGPADRPRARAFIPIWRRPWMSINRATYASTLLARVGVANVLADRAERYPTVLLPEVGALGADVVLAPSEPYPFGERHRLELSAVAPVVFVDGRDLFWWGVRTSRALARLTTLLGEMGTAAGGRDP
jgi:ABC-type Fe3+-hydroxamate transport system substrate-binding protein